MPLWNLCRVATKDEGRSCGVAQNIPGESHKTPCKDSYWSEWKKQQIANESEDLSHRMVLFTSNDYGSILFNCRQDFKKWSFKSIQLPLSETFNNFGSKKLFGLLISSELSLSIRAQCSLLRETGQCLHWKCQLLPALNTEIGLSAHSGLLIWCDPGNLSLISADFQKATTLAVSLRFSGTMSDKLQRQHVHCDTSVICRESSAAEITFTLQPFWWQCIWLSQCNHHNIIALVCHVLVAVYPNNTNARCHPAKAESKQSFSASTNLTPELYSHSGY